MKVARGVLIGVGLLSIAFALLGLLYNSSTLAVGFSGAFSGPARDLEVPYFVPAFYTMSAICIGCYAVLFVCGVQFVRLRAGVLPLFVGVLLFEVVYFFAVAVTWAVPTVGMSVGAATGVANGGLMFQGCVLFPFWAPPLAWWAKKRLSRAQESQAQGRPTTSQTPQPEPPGR